MNKKVLIVCHTFPPYPGIGGRRWAKFANYLQEKGTDVFVLASESPFEEKSQWSNDISKINIKRLPLNYPKALITFPSNLFGRIKYKLSKLFVQIVSKGNYYDRSLFWKDQLIKDANEIIEIHKIKNVIVSGGPFHLMHHCLKLKELHPNLNLIVDFRDFWTDDLSMGPLNSMSVKRINFEVNYEKEVLKKADCVITVSDFMTKTLQAKSAAKKIITLVNGFDEADFNVSSTENQNTDIMTFVFTGSLYNNIDSVFEPFCEALQKLKIKEPDLYKKSKFDFYGSSASKNIELVKKYNLDIVKFHKPLALKDIFQKINNADYCMLFLNDLYSFSLSTKFCEYIGLRKPIVLFSKKGETSNFIESNALGYWVNPENTYDTLLNLIKSKKDILINEKFELIREQYSVSQISNYLNESILI